MHKIFTVFFTIFFLAGCGNWDGGSNNTSPTVSSTSPTDGATGVAINKKITTTFSEEMDPLTITTTTFTVTGPGSTPVSGTVTYVGVTATFTPKDNLAYDTTYTATITTDVEDLAGNSLASDYEWSFTTGNAPDITLPTVSSVVPANAAAGVAINKKITATFSEEMDPLTITTSTFMVAGPGATPVSGTVTYVGVTATFTATGNLAYDTTYTATITTDAEDLAGNALASDYEWSFTTGDAPDTTLPTVSSTDPANLATGVAINKKIAATFSEEMDPLTITTTTFTVTRPGSTAVSGTVDYVGVTATFTPSDNLAYDTTYTATMTTDAEDLAGNALASDYEWSFTSGDAPDNTLPTVSSTDPANLATGVAINKKIAATFSEAMYPLTINTITFAVTGPGATPVLGAVTYVGVTATFKPSSNLEYNTTYTATIYGGIFDSACNRLASDYIWSFTTGNAPDTTLPTVSSTSPTDGATGVAINKKIAATFSEAMDPLTITTTTFTVTGPGSTAVSGTVDYVGVTATFTPSGNLAYGTTYKATITTDAEDLAGNALASDYEWSFTSGDVPDTTPPTVNSTDPANLATGVPINKKIAATFSEAMYPLSINTNTFTITGPGATPVLGAVTYVGVTATFKPSSNLEYNTTYMATIRWGIYDSACNRLASDYEWSFTSGDDSDTTLPTVSSTSPADGATGVAINKKITATFSEAMDPLTITTSTFMVAGPGATPVSGAVTYVGVTATFSPSDNLAYGTTYTATIATDAEDLAGNTLASEYEWSFTTGATPDTTKPIVLSTNPVDASIDVLVNKKIAATFSEAMDPLTINTTTFRVAGPGTTPVSGAVTYVGTTATFTPASDLAGNTEFTATITTYAEDLAGNGLASDFEWTFTTGEITDTIAPEVLSTDPADGDTDVCTNKSINATFSESMDSLTITNITFTVAGKTGLVTYDPMTDIASFTPATDLALSTTYTATISTEAKDLAGNSMANDYEWSFTTGLTPCASTVSLGAAAPFGTFGGGAGMTNQGLLTVINGDIATTGVSTTVTGFYDQNGDIYTVTPLNNGKVNGSIYTAPPSPGGAGVGGTAVTFAIATQAALDAQTAYDNLTPASMPGGMDPGAGQLGGLTLAPGIYQAAGGSFLLTGSDLTLDAQGDANAVWVFQMASSLSVGGPGAAFPRSVIMTNGAQAKNVFWQVGSAATINAAGGGTMVGTIIAYSGVAISTPDNMAIATLNGRALGLNASVTMVNTVINVPAE